MHRFPKIFSNSSERRKSFPDSGSGAKQKRLERRNAAKDINYEFSPSSSASSSSYLSEDFPRTRSADLYLDRTSFRVDGTDGEFDIICKTFGFSGIDDFQINPDEFQTMKVMRSSSSPEAFVQSFEPIVYHETEVSQGSNEVVGSRFEQGCIDTGRDSVSEQLNRFEDVLRVSENRGNGIKGVRPPVLKPPSLMSLPLMEKGCSTWNASRGLGMCSYTCDSKVENGYCMFADDAGIQHEEDMRKMLESPYCFSTSSNDDDSSSSTTDPVSSISPSGKFRLITKDWQKGDLLGSGSFGSVYEGISDDGFFFAVKEVSLLERGDNAKQSIFQLEQEIALLSQFQHENIVQYYGTKKDESHLYIFLELVTKGSLLSLYQKYDMRIPQVSAYTRQILRGLKYLHNRNVVHRDIKCANILVHTNGLVKLADFGLAKATKLNDVKSCKGTAFWMAPEVVRSQWYGLAADIWSLGCTVLEMITRRFPYSHLECMEAAIFRIGRGERPHIPDSLPTDARDFVLQCLQIDPSLRPTAAELLEHPFVKGQLTSSSSSASPHNSSRLI